MARMDAQPSYRRFPNGTGSNRRPLRLEFLEPRLALSGVDVGTLSAPDAPLWAVAPYALCDTSVAMTVKQISGLEYYFRNVTDASHDSGWITEANNSVYFNYPGYVTYVDQGLMAATPYNYTVKARVGSSGEGGDWSTQATVTTLDAMEAAVQRLTNQIRTIETFSSPDNPGQITSQLANGQYPDPTQPNNFTTCEKSGTHGVAAYPGDGRNTPGAFQVDLANMGKTDPNNPWIEVFGEWKGTAGSAKNASPYDTQIALSKQTLEDFFNLEVSAAGLITHIEARAAAIFLHDDALADAVGWDPVDNPLIGHHIDNFQSEQLALYLAGRDAKDSGVGVSDPRTSHPAILRDAETLQYQVSKSFMWAAYQKFLNHPDYGGTFAKVVDLYGATLSITSSQGTAAVPIFGVKEGDTFKCRLTPAFVLGGTYVRGEGNMIGLLTALVKANEEGTGVWRIDNLDVTFTLTNPGAATVNKVFTVDRTPGNVGASYPSIFHYGAVMSPFGMIDYTADPQTFDPADLILVAGDAAKPAWGVEGRNTAAGLGYTRLAAADVHTVSGTQTVRDGGQYNYRDLEDGKTLTLAGAETFVVLGQSSSAAGPRITSSGYPFNNDKTVSAGQQIDISDYFNEGFVGNNTDILNSSFYGWWGADGQMMARVNDPSVPENTALFLYFAPAAKDLGAAGPQAVLDNQGKFYDTASPYYHTARVGAANVNVLGRPANADAWAVHFLTQAVPPGTGVIDASATTGRVFIVLDKTVEKVKLGTGSTVVIALAENASRKTFVLNPNAPVAPTIGLRSGDVIDWSMLPQTVTWTAGAATTFDNKAAATSPYLRYSYYAGWAAQGGLPGVFQAIVRANGNTGTDDPAKIVENALNPLTVTIGRAAGQARQTSASLMNYTVVFSQEVDDFDEDAVHLLGLQDTLSGAQIVITNPGGDRMTYNVAITLLDTAATGNISGTIIADAVHNADGFSNLPSTASTGESNIVSYIPNTIAGYALSNASWPSALANQQGEPLPGMHVSLASLTHDDFAKRWTTTDEYGRYSFGSVPDGTYQVHSDPPVACIDLGTNTKTADASGSQTVEADFHVGALKAGRIPNRMMVTSSLPVGSAQWRLVVRQALGIGESGVSQSAQTQVARMNSPATTQYLVLAGQPESLPSSATPAAQQQASGTVNTVRTQAVTGQAQRVPAGVAPPVAPVAAATAAPSNKPTGAANSGKTANNAAVREDGGQSPLAQAAVAPIVEEAIARWAAAGMDAEAIGRMRNASFLLANLDGAYLGMTRGSTVWLDVDAAGREWFVDPTPAVDEEFIPATAAGALQAIDPEALDRIDLLTVVAHELGHVAGLKDSDLDGLMAPSLEAGLRLLPSTHDAVLAGF